MNLILNHFAFSMISATDLLRVKISGIVNKNLHNTKARFIFAVAQDSEHRGMFSFADEIVCISFDPSVSSFWEKIEIGKIVYFLTNSSSADNLNCLIKPVLFKALPNEIGSSECAFASSVEHSEISYEVISFYSSYMNTDIIPKQIKLYDASFFYVSDKWKPQLSTLLKKMCDIYVGYIDSRKSDIILSLCIHIMQQENYFEVNTLDLEYTTILSHMLNDFYVIN